MLKVTFQLHGSSETHHVDQLDSDNFRRLRSRVYRIFTDPSETIPTGVLMEASGEILQHIVATFGGWDNCTIPVSRNKEAKWTNDLALTILVNL